MRSVLLEEILLGRMRKKNRIRYKGCDYPFRLLAWAEAFDAWMSEKEAQRTRSVVKQARYAWRRLLGTGEGSPWEFREGHIQAHAAWMEELNTNYIESAIVLFGLELLHF